MSKTDDTVAALKSIVAMLLKSARQTNAGVESLRLLLEERGVFSGAEFDAMFQKIQQRQDQAFAQSFSEAQEDAHDATLRTMLEKLGGRPQ